MANVLDFPAGTRVRYTGRSRRGVDIVGKPATVVRPVKSRKVVTIRWDDSGDWYDAFPGNLEKA